MDAPCRHLRIFLFPHKVDLGRADIGGLASSDAHSELRQQLASTFGRFTVDHSGVGPIMLRPMAEAAVAAVPDPGIGTGQRCSGEPPPSGGVRDRARMEVAPEAKSPLGPPK